MDKHEAKTLLNFVPNHTRTSCSDENIANWHTTAGRDGYPRCTRCALLRASLDHEYGEDLNVSEIRVRLPEIEP
ncbi:hypothetical protein [Metapseudomonas otitidis]|uniref:hypothetical protein n=1 Tax=Metapseudomonas otitidis TaxID=319939 RepID=UPI0036717B9E